ncbi:hypothetical protein Tco_0548130 [Tanacetum coccineum]
MVEKDVPPNNANVIAPGMFRLDLEPLAPKLLKNRDAHIDYIKHTQEHADTLWEIVEHARELRPLDSDLDSASKYAKRIQESYTSDEPPIGQSPKGLTRGYGKKAHQGQGFWTKLLTKEAQMD